MAWGSFRATLSKNVLTDGWRGGWIRYAFLEEAEQISSDRLIGPSGQSLGRLTHAAATHRFRFATVSASDFNSRAHLIAPLADDPDPAARRLRRQQLQAAFGESSMPVVDVYVPPSEDLIESLLASPSGWYLMIALPGKPEGDELLAIIGDPESGEEDLVARLQLLRPAGFAEAQLRNIFSLAHVADLGDDDDDGGGEPEPLPDPPSGAPVLVVDQLRAWWKGEDVIELEIEEVAEPTWERAEPQRQMIRLTE